jgi:MFS family permease
MPQQVKAPGLYRELLPLTLAVMTGVLSTSFSAIFVNIALPDVMVDFSVTATTVHWLITAFVTFATLTMLLAGWAANRVGVRVLFLGSLAAFILSSLLGGFAWHIGLVIAARGLQGACMGFISVLALMTLFAAFPVSAAAAPAPFSAWAWPWRPPPGRPCRVSSSSGGAGAGYSSYPSHWRCCPLLSPGG